MLSIERLRDFLREYQASPAVKSTIDSFIRYIGEKQSAKGTAVISYERTQATKRLLELRDRQARYKEEHLSPEEDFERIQTNEN